MNSIHEIKSVKNSVNKVLIDEHVKNKMTHDHKVVLQAVLKKITHIKGMPCVCFRPLIIHHINL